MAKYHKSNLLAIFIVTIITVTPANIQGEEFFIENFEQDEIPANYSLFWKQELH